MKKIIIILLTILSINKFNMKDAVNHSRVISKAKFFAADGEGSESRARIIEP